MNFYFENQGTHTYLVYTVAEEDTVDSLSLGMLTNNRIHGLAHTLFTQMDSAKYIKYDVSAKISVKQFFSGVVNKKRLLGVFNGIVDAMLSAEDYMLDINTILLDLDYIFADVSTCETVLICVPVVSDDLYETNFNAFFRDIMISTQFDQTENCDYMAKILNFLNSNPMLSLSDFKKVLQSMDEDNSVNQPQPSVVQNVYTQPVQPAQVPQRPAQPSVSTVQGGQSGATKPVQPKPVQPQKPTAPQKPAKQPPAPPAQPSVAAQGASEEKISWFYLMQHYNSENAAKYKAQKAAKKSGGSNKVPPQPTTRTANDANRPNKSSNEFGFAVPCQQTSVQQAPVPQAPAQSPIQQVPAQRPVQQPVQRPVINQPTYTQHQMPQGQSMNFGETTVLGGGGVGETTVLGATPAAQAIPNLIRMRNNEKIILNKPVFRIGKEKSYVDYFIGDNSAISRSHANIITREGEYFVVDTNSTNHTYVDGAMIQSSVETKITHGTKIRLANEDFEFKLY